MVKKVGKFLMVTIIALMVLAIPSGYVAGKIYYGNHKSAAEEQARTYSKEMGYNIKGLSCTNRDTDGDDYVSCTISTSEGQVYRVLCVGNIPPWPLGPFIPNKGCKNKLQGNMTSE